MRQNKPKVIIICGPTASGKSDVAIKLAKQLNGEVISADSRQVYKGMNIGSGKVIKDQVKRRHVRTSERKNMRRGTRDMSHVACHMSQEFYSDGIRHYLIDIAEPTEEFNISHFKKLAEKALAEILAKGKLPIICGGTGFWIQAVVENVQLPNVKPNAMLRSTLRNKSAEELFAMLAKLDPERAKNIDPKNSVRLIRAIEIATELGTVPTLSNVERQTSNEKYEFLRIGLNVEREVLNAKIKKRLDERFELGMIEEVENLHKNGVSWERLETFGLEYRWLARYLQGRLSFDEMQEKLYFDIIHYAKRQLTWWRRKKELIWLKSYPEINSCVSNFLNQRKRT